MTADPVRQEPADVLALKPCPFCLAEPHTLLRGICYPDGSIDKEGAVMCPMCGCRATLKAWNTRAAASPAPDVRVDLRTRIALEIWHRWADTNVETFEDETHKEEYLQCADAILALTPAEVEPRREEMPHVTLAMEEAGREHARKNDPSTFAGIFEAMWKAKSSDGRVESRHAECPQGRSCAHEPEAGNTVSSGQATAAGVAPGPSEASLPPRDGRGEPVAWQWRYVGNAEWLTPSGGQKLSDEELKRNQHIEQRPLYALPPVDQDAATIDVRWAVNVLLEKIAAKFEAWDTYDIWRSDAASTVRSFKHDLAARTDLDKPTSPLPNPAEQCERGLNFFNENVDAWGALEWFDRMAKALREQDAAVLSKDDATLEICQNVAASSAMRLVRDYEHQVRAALSQEAGKK